MQNSTSVINDNPNDRIETLNDMFATIYGEDHKQRLLRVLWVLMEDQKVDRDSIQRLQEAFEHIIVFHRDFSSFEWQYDSGLNPTHAALMAVDILWQRHIIDYYAQINHLHNNLTYFILSEYWPDSAHESVCMFFEEEGGKFFYTVDNKVIFL